MVLLGELMDGQNRLYWNGETKPFSPQPDNVKDFFRTGHSYINTIALDAGNENSSVRFSYTNNNVNGLLENSYLRKNNFNLRGSTKMGKLSLDAKVTYFLQEANNRATQGTEGILAYVYGAPRNTDFEDLRDYQNTDYSVNSWSSSSGNPYWILYNDRRYDTRNRIQGFAKAQYEFTDWLSAFVRIGTDRVSQRIETVDNYGHWFFATGRFNYSDRTVTETNADFLLMLNKDLGSDINLSVNLGGNSRYNTYIYQSVYGEDFKIPTKPTTESAQILKPYYRPLQEKKVHSLYGNASISYKNMIYLDISGRNDWSSTLPEDNWSYFYPSVSLSLLLDQMIPFFGNNFDLFKVRGSWAQVGNDTSPYQLEDSYILQQEGYLGLTTLSRPSVKMNPELKPETTTSNEIGIEFSMFNHRLFGDFSYYKIESKDLIMDVPVPASTGYDKFRENVGLMVNEGAEFMIGGTPVISNDFRWEVSFNFSKNNNRLVELAEDIDNFIFSTTNSGNVVVQATVGGQFGEIWGTVYERDPNGKIVVDATGRPIAASEKQLLGNYQPDWLAGLKNTLSYKNLSLDFLIDFRIGGQLYSGTDAAMDALGVSKRSLQYRENDVTIDGVVNTGTSENPVYETNTNAITGQEYWQNRVAADYIYDQTNIRLREVSLIYSLPKSVIKGNFIQSVSIGFIARNLFFIMKDIENFDPESSYSTSNFAQGMLYYNMPTTRSFGFNLNIKF
ncbi:MAG: TonB-dependent receptor [Bacteroidales bacterium]|nr:TonB-dependent receptor [Bacteroidales bacterium]